MGTVNRFAVMLAAALVAASIPRATFASPDPSSVDTAGKKPPSAVEDAARNDRYIFHQFRASVSARRLARSLTKH